MGFLSRRSATAQKKPIVSDDLAAPPPELEMNMDDLWEQALARDRQKKKKVSGVIVGAALCCLPGATLGSIYDDWRASKEAPEMERRARAHQAELQTQRRSTTLPWGDETFAIMGTRSIQDIVAEVDQNRQQPPPAAKPAPKGIQLTAHAAAA